MTLRRKLLTTFGGLGLMALVVTGATLWTIMQWRATESQLQDHYQRSLLLQRVRATAFRAFKEVPDAVTGGDQDARQEFEALIRPADEDFQRWADLADTDQEREEVRRVREAYDAILRDARRVFDLVDDGRREEAFDLLEGQLEDRRFLPFQELTEQAVAADQERREVIRGQVQNAQRTAQLVLALAAFATLSLILLLFAYLTSDLFAPLLTVEEALTAVARGDCDHRLDEGRGDEIGEVNRAFNRMAKALAEREQALGLTAVPARAEDDGQQEGSWHRTPARVTLHALVTQLQRRVKQLDDGATGEDGAQRHEVLTAEIQQLVQTVARVTAFGFPLDLNLAPTDIRALLYELVLRFHDRFVQRTVSLELHVAPEVGEAVVDRLKLREVLGELIQNALDALPEQGGSIGLRASLDREAHELVLEVADDGAGMPAPAVDRVFRGNGDGQNARPGVGLTMARAIVEQHGGRLTLESEAGQGTHVVIRLPFQQ